MKKLLFSVLLLLGCVTGYSATYYKVTLLVTSVPPVSATLDANGDTRRFTNNTPAVAGKFLQTTNTLQATATNIYQHVSLYAFTNINAVKLGTNNTSLPTNTVVFETTADNFVSFTALSNYCTITYSTNATAIGFIGVRVPYSNETAIVQTQVSSGLVQWFNSNAATNRVLSNAAPFTNFLNNTRVGAQSITNLNTIGGTNRPTEFLSTNGGQYNTWASNLLTTNLTGTSLNLTNVSPYDTNGIYTNVVRANVNLLLASNLVALGGSISNGTITNVAWINGFLGGLTNGQLWNVQITNSPFAVVTNLKVFGDGYLSNIIIHTLTATQFNAPGSGLASLQIGSGAEASGQNSVAVGDSAQATTNDAIALGRDSAAGVGEGAIAIGEGTAALAYRATAVGKGASVSGWASAAFGAGATAGHSNSTAIGYNASTTTTNQVRIGTSAEHVSIPGRLETAYGLVANNVSNYQSGIWGFKVGDYTAMTGGSNNVVALSTNRWTRISGHVSAANVNSLSGSTPEREIGIINAGSYDLTLVDESGFETTATNRLALPNNLNMLLPVDAAATFQRDETLGRWRLIGVSYVSATATNIDADYIDLNPIGSQPHSRGRLYYNTNNESLSFFNNEAQIEANIPFESWIRVVPNTGVTITNGTPCYLNGGVSNGIPTCAPCSAAEVTSARFAGFATMTITNGNIGYLTPFGTVNGLNLTNSLTNGSPLYLSQTIIGGVASITNVPPTNGAVVRLGVLTSSNSTAGTIFTQPLPLVEMVGTASLDFASTAAGMTNDLPITVSGCTSNSIVTGLGVPWQSQNASGSFSTYTSNGTVYVRFSNHSAGAANPNPGIFRVLVKTQF